MYKVLKFSATWCAPCKKSTNDIETNGWRCDYYMYIWKNGEYTGYALHGSYYYGDHKIELNEV